MVDERIIEIFENHRPVAGSDFLPKVHLLAWGLAKGASENLWEPKFKVSYNKISTDFKGGKLLKEYLYYCWVDNYPAMSFLESFEYVERTDTWRSPRGRQDPLTSVITPPDSDTYKLTPKAFQLLETPLTPPKVFISYKRGISTALALLVEARLKALSGDMNPFLDKHIPVGDDWHPHLEEKVKSADTFILLVGGEDTFSHFVMNEIRWAKESGSKIISIWHGELKERDYSLCPDQELRDFITSKHNILVDGHEAKQYEVALIELENTLHYF